VTGAQVDLLQARALAKEGLLGAAEPLLMSVLEDIPRDPKPWATLGVLYADSERIPEAIEALEHARSLDTTDAAVLNNLGFLYLIEMRFEDARDVLKDAIGLDGTQSLYRNNLAFALVGLDNHVEALRLFRTTNSESEARYNLGLAFARIGKSTSARIQLERALTLDPEHELAKETLASLTTDAVPEEALEPSEGIEDAPTSE
jgi:Flp pilus assembly protein TadD